jgi:hypothetical protein
MMQLHELRPKMQIWHNQTPYELIANVWYSHISAKWLVERLFVSHDRIEILILQSDNFHLAHFHSHPPNSP